MQATTSVRAQCATELSVTVLTGGIDPIGTLLFNPVQIIFDNQSLVDIAIYQGAVLWKTFQAGEAIVLDMRGNHGIAADYTFPIGTVFNAVGAAGANPFRISYTYALTIG